MEDAVLEGGNEEPVAEKLLELVPDVGKGCLKVVRFFLLCPRLSRFQWQDDVGKDDVLAAVAFAAFLDAVFVFFKIALFGVVHGIDDVDGCFHCDVAAFVLHHGLGDWDDVRRFPMPQFGSFRITGFDDEHCGPGMRCRLPVDGNVLGWFVAIALCFDPGEGLFFVSCEGFDF